MAGAMNRLLIADDESGICNFLSLVAERLNFEVRTAATKEEFATQFCEFRPTVVILDLNLQGTSGTELLRYLANQNAPARVFLISGEDVRTLYAAEHLGVMHGLRMAGVLQKPLMLVDLEDALSRVVNAPDSGTELAGADETDVYKQFDAGEFHRIKNALAKAEVVYTETLEIGRTVLASEYLEKSSESHSYSSGAEI